MRYAVIPTRGDRDRELRRCIAAIRPQVEEVFLIDNSDAGHYFQTDQAQGVTVLYDWQQPPNLSHLWNQGINAAATRASGKALPRWEVAVLNDDVEVSTDWFETLTSAMRDRSAAAAGFGPVNRPVLHTVPGPTALHERLPGFAFILAGELGARMDENLQWWCGDNDIDMQSRGLGGTLILPGEVLHHFPDQSTYQNPALSARTGVDMALFVQKWGFRPW